MNEHPSDRDRSKLYSERTEPPRGAESLMSSVVALRYGPPENLITHELPRPQCGTDQVLIRVHAAGVNPIDWRIRSGSLRWLLPIRFPLIPGYDVAGEIADIGSSIEQDTWKLGDRVFCYLNNRHGGGYAEYAVAGADVVARMPAGISFAQAASIPLAATTALQALRDLAQLQVGQDVLINGASGGVGTFAVQIARVLGANITGVCGASNIDYVLQLGAGRVIDYREEDFTRQERTYDVVFDVAAKSSYMKCRRILKGYGRYITTVPSGRSLLLQVVTHLGKRRCLNILARPSGADLRSLANMIEEGKMRTEIQHTYPLANAAEAHRVSQEGHVRGKLVLLMH